MGASNIEFKLPKSKFPTEQSVMKWYNEAVQEATLEYGRDAYNGTISTTRGITFFYPAFDNEEKANEFVLERSEKWGKMAAVLLEEEGKPTYWFIGGWAAS
jgi:hypothetical protein